MSRITKETAVYLIFSFCALFVLSSCQLDSLFGQNGQQDEVVQSSLPRDLNPEVSDSEFAELIADNTDFAFDLYNLIRDEPGNQFYSPLSISLALAMTYGGARGETASEMAEALNFTLPQDQFHPAFNALDLELASRGSDSDNFELAIANATWGQSDYTFLSSYLDLLAVNYGAAMRLLDFVSAPDASRLVINEWVSDQTNGKIQDLLPRGSITPLTVLVLTNAIYFNAKWLNPFPKEGTFDGPFTLLDGSHVNVPMMNHTVTTPYIESDGVAVLELPYKGEETSMVILMPERSQFASFESSLTSERLNALLAGLQSSQMNLTLPKFSYTSELDLIPMLRALGMEQAFTGGVADFSGMDGTRDLYISGVLHKAFVAVDEEGTEAAAATGVIVGRTSAPNLEVRIDHPFIFVIRDRVTGTLLFVGRVVDPGN